MKQIVLKHGLSAAPCADDFTCIEAAEPLLPKGGIIIEQMFISLDPYVGSRLRGNHMGEAAPEPGVGVIPGAAVGRVLRSDSPAVKEGDYVHTMEGGWRERAGLEAGDFTKINPKAAPLESYVGVLGMPGLTAWAGVTQLAQIGPGDVFMVNAAAGPVGGTAGQIARQRGASKIIGIAGGADKCARVEQDYGFDICVDYRKDGWMERIKSAAPEGISVHFENVGAEQLSFAMSQLKLYGRVVLCGLAAHYHDGGPKAATSIGMIIAKRAKVHGLVVYDFYPKWDEFRAEVAPWVKSGAISILQDEAKGLEAAPALLEKLMAGKNLGKCIVKL